MASEQDDDPGASTVRLTFRTYLPYLERLFVLARKNGWTNGKGKPNLSKAVNHLVAQLDVSDADEDMKKKAHRDAIAFLEKEG